MHAWYELGVSGMQDSSQGKGALWLVGENGTIWQFIAGNSPPTRQTQEWVFDPATGSRLKPTGGFRRIAATKMAIEYAWAAQGSSALYVCKERDGNFSHVTTTGGRFDSGIEDVAVDYHDAAWVVSHSGYIYKTADGVNWESHSIGLGSRRIAIAPDDIVWAIFLDGTVWRGTPDGAWYPTKGSGMEDISVGVDGTVWLVGTNGTVWTTRDGQSFDRTEASGMRAVSAVTADTAYAVGSNGTVWYSDRPPTTSTPTGTPTTTTPSPQLRPHIDVQQSGPLTATKYTITGTGFLPSLSSSPQTIQIRGVDGVNLQDRVTLQTNSDSAGKISVTTGAIDTTLLQRNSFGQAIVNFSAADSRTDPASTPANQPLWSNTVPFLY